MWLFLSQSAKALKIAQSEKKEEEIDIKEMTKTSELCYVCKVSLFAFFVVDSSDQILIADFNTALLVHV